MLSLQSAKSLDLLSTSLFRPVFGYTTTIERTNRVYARAKALAKAYDLTSHDVTSLMEKFWALTADNVFAVDPSAIILLTIQYNLAAGTLAPFAAHRPELRVLLNQMLTFEVSAQFLLTELAHGLDAKNIETTATLLPSGDYDLHTPRLEASKFMPPSGIIEGMDRVGIVIARLIVDGDDRGLRPFVVLLSTNGEMCEGITSRLLPGRPGTESLDHAITTFTHVRLPASALLGDQSKPADFRQNFMGCIHRVAIGSLAVTLVTIPALAVSAFIAAKYSMLRTVAASLDSAGASTRGRMTIWTFRTQQVPILRAFAKVAVMKAFAREAITLYSDPEVLPDPRVRTGIACCVKAFLLQQSESSLLELSERCGAQGLFLHNQIAAVQLAIRGAAIAEGDALAICIRLATELLLGRYELPAPRHPMCLLAKHEKAYFARCRKALAEVGQHRSERFSQRLLPLCRPLVEAIGHRMAYEAAVDSGTVHKPLLELFEITAVRINGAWFAEQLDLDLGVRRQEELEEAAVTAAVPYVHKYMEDSEAEAYAQAPILSEARLRNFVQGLDRSGDATVKLHSLLEDETEKFERVNARL